MPRICSRKRSISTEEYAPALLGMALVAGENFEAQAIKFAEEALKADPKLVEAHEVIARVQLEDNDPEKAAEAAHKALEIDQEALDAMAVLGTIDMLADKNDTPWMTRVLAINPQIRQRLRHRGALLHHQPPLRGRHRDVSQGAGAGSRRCRARAAIWA